MDKALKVYKVKVNDYEFEFTNKQVDGVNIIQRSANHFHLLHNHLSTKGTLIRQDASGKKQWIEIDGETLAVEIKDELDQMLDKMGFSAQAAKQIKEIKAPMPGLVLEINVSEGQSVTIGEKLLILVAMKMENSLTIPVDAVIKKINVKPGQPVEKGQVLLELE